MGFLPKKWLRALWGVQQPQTELSPAIDCADCREARARGGDACAVHGAKHPRPHTYSMGHEVSWASPLKGTNEEMPVRTSESIH
jgi:hypothetical protein